MTICRDQRRATASLKVCGALAVLALFAAPPVTAAAMESHVGAGLELALYSDATCSQDIQTDARGHSEVVECQSIWVRAMLRWTGDSAFESGRWLLKVNGADYADLGPVPCIGDPRSGCQADYVSQCIEYRPTAEDVVAGRVLFTARYGDRDPTSPNTGWVQRGRKVPGLSLSVPQVAAVKGCARGQCAEQCSRICRTASEWGQTGGDECGAESVCNNLTQAVIDSTASGRLEVCGQMVTQASPLGTLSSALEGLCVDSAGVSQRSIYRELLAASLNSIASGDPSASLIPLHGVNWASCNAACAAGGAANPSEVRACIEQLSCWNAGGKLANGACLPMADSCMERGVTSSPAPNLQLLSSSPGPASSAEACNKAISNGCAIDNCSS